MSNFDVILEKLDSFEILTGLKDDVKKIVDSIKKGESNNIAIKGDIESSKAIEELNELIKLLGIIFKEAGIIEFDDPKVIQAYDLKGAFLGLSKDKVNKITEEAKGRILFIDDINYLLVNENGAADPYAKEALDTLLSTLVNKKDEFVCVAFGSPNNIDNFLNKILGMSPRFKNIITLP